jgi:hypothetical protein
MYHYIVIGGYFLWKYYYVLEYGYTALYYTNIARHAVFDKDEKDFNDWILCDSDYKDLSVIVETK